MGFPLYKPYIQLICEDEPSILGTNEIFGALNGEGTYIYIYIYVHNIYIKINDIYNIFLMGNLTSDILQPTSQQILFPDSSPKSPVNQGTFGAVRLFSKHLRKINKNDTNKLRVTCGY